MVVIGRGRWVGDSTARGGADRPGVEARPPELQTNITLHANLMRQTVPRKRMVLDCSVLPPAQRHRGGCPCPLLNQPPPRATPQRCMEMQRATDREHSVIRNPWALCHKSHHLWRKAPLTDS